MVLATTISQAAVGAHAVVSTRLADSGTGKRFTSPGRTTYYVDSATGNDGGAGTSIHGAWKTIERVNQTAFAPGDRVLFAGGQTFKGTLLFTKADSGAKDKPILVSSFG